MVCLCRVCHLMLATNLTHVDLRYEADISAAIICRHLTFSYCCRDLPPSGFDTRHIIIMQSSHMVSVKSLQDMQVNVHVLQTNTDDRDLAAHREP